MIADSGERRVFDTGAVRDMAEGKGRCDLMPLDIVCAALGNDAIMRDIADYQATGSVEWLYDALNLFSKVRYIGVPDMFLDVAKHFEDGAAKYGERNWEKGLPEWCYIDSAVRHYLKWLRRDSDEHHDRAFVWNIICCLWTVTHKSPPITE